MGKKQKYKLPEHEQHHNRVDIFRPLKFTDDLQPSTFTPVNAYTNHTFVSSTHDLTSDIEPINTLTNNINNKILPPNVKRKFKSSIWSTTSSLIENAKYFPRDAIEEPRRTDSANATIDEITTQISAKTADNRKKLVIIFLVFLLFISLATVALGLTLTIRTGQSLAEIVDFKSVCYPKCKSNTYCVRSEYEHKNASCICKPGYVENSMTNECEEFLCYTNYSPYTYFDDRQSFIAVPKSSIQIKPYCCPNQNYLTPACCGLATANRSLTVTKRIIGGSTVAPGVFPWIVYVAQVYRTNTNAPFEIIKNCSGALISDRYVLTAAQ